MTTNFYGVNSSFFDTYFGNSSKSSNSNGNTTSMLFSSLSTANTTASSLTSAFGELQLIKSGAYKKALTAYYDLTKTNKSESISDSDSADSNTSLSTVKSTAKALNESAKALQSNDFDTATREELLTDVKDFASDYNNMLNSTKKLNSYSMLQTAVWATEQMNISEGMLNRVGITIQDDNTLAVNEETFKNAKLSDIKVLFEGNTSLASRISQKASTLVNQSANQMSLNLGTGSYTKYGTWS